MNYVLDTDVAVEYLRGNPETVRKVLNLTEVFITVITAAELFYGVHKSNKPKKNRAELLNLLNGTHLLGFDFGSSEAFGRIKSELRKKGKLTGDFDIAIASICMTNDLTLLTNNLKHYRHIENLKILQF